MFYKILITVVMAAMLVTSANAQTITPTGLSQGDLVALLQNVVNALGANVGSTYLSVTGSVAPSFSGVLAADGGITVDTDKFTVADGTGNTVVGGTFNSKGAATFDSKVTATSGTNYTTILLANTTATTGNTWELNSVGSTGNFVLTDEGLFDRLHMNTSGNMTLGATDKASTIAKFYADGAGYVGIVAATSGGNYNIDAYQDTSTVGAGAAMKFSAKNSAGTANTTYADILVNIVDNTASSHSGNFNVRTLNKGTTTTAFIINDSQNVSLASTDIATTVAKAAVAGRVRLDGTVTGTNTAASPVLDLEFFDQSDSSTKTAQSAGAGYVSLLAVKTSAGKHALWMVGPTGTTVEVAIEP